MAESRFQRWSRRKSEVRKQAEPTPPPGIESAPYPEEQESAARELAVNEALPEREVLDKYGLPDPDTIELGADITGFMRKEIPELLRRKALRALWKSNPVLAVLDGLNDYDEDYTDAALATKSVNTLYKAGQGFIEKKNRGVGHEEVPAGQRTSASEPIAPDPEPAAPAGTNKESEPETAATPSSTTRPVESASNETDDGPEPRYRPRMRFES
ncbi:DUF3306 domain-containing protein [Marinobacter pelagius]|uniref:DUF3306 domain-containing protein n=1 Tax=Marinobacter sp. C7 TaxID=2951363 RepID=UPI001EF0DD34|nr:DUF3306 domain-containing protein [Marinobacter sp. C7]MCG7200726.1 DUF3306 domain-containing protein [Marinobacter sp. C7]